jgi:hypothetical protein
MSTNNDYDAEYEAIKEAHDIIQYYFQKVGGAENTATARNAEEFYEYAAKLIRMAHGLSPDQLDRLANVLSKPWKRTVRGAPPKNDNRQWVWEQCFSFLGVEDRGGKHGDPLPTRTEALKIIQKKYRMTPDQARKLYDDVDKNGLHKR